MFEYLFAIALVFLVITIYLYKKLYFEIKTMQSDRQSILTSHGKSMEQFIPFLKGYPYNKENFRFLGTPIDGVQFEDDKIVFVEFKTGESRLSGRQENVKKLVGDRKVEFKEIRT